jgi:hypothetical protein
MKKTNTATESQSERFKQLARELGCDEPEERFEAVLKAVAKHHPVGSHRNGIAGKRGRSSLVSGAAAEGWGRCTIRCSRPSVCRDLARIDRRTLCAPCRGAGADEASINPMHSYV